MNEVEIVVKSNDKTTMTEIGQRFKSSLSQSVKGGMADADRTVTSRFKEIGDHGGKSLASGLRPSFGSIEHDATGAFKGVVKAGEGASKSLVDSVRESSAVIRGPAALGAVAVAIQALPTIASVAGGGLALALGGAFALVGLKAQASTADVKNAFSDLRKHVSSELKRITAPVHDTLGHMIDDARRGFDSLTPALSGVFAKIAPAVTKFAGQFSSSLARLNPAIASVGAAFDRVLGALGPRLGAIMNNVGTGIKAIMDGVAANPKGFAEMAEDLSQIVRVGGDVIGFLARFSSQLNIVFEVANGLATGPVGLLLVGLHRLAALPGSLFGGFGKGLKDMGGAAGGAADAVTETGMSTQQLLSAQKAATLTSDQLKAALDRLTGANQNAFDAQTQYKQALVAANRQAKDNNAGLDGNSKAALANRQALSQLATAIKNNIEAGDVSSRQIAKMRASFVRAAEGMGLSKKAAEDLADKLIGVKDSAKKVPSNVTTHLEARDDTKHTVRGADKGLKGFAKRVYRASLTAQSKVNAAVRAAGRACLGFARRTYRASLSAVNRVSGAVRSAISACLGFARRTYRASLSAVNRANSALAAALRAGRSWAGRVFTATFNVIRHIIPGFAHGGIVGGGYAHGGITHAAGGGPRSNLTLVGEQGAELVRLPTGSTVIPHGQSMAMLSAASGGRGGPIHITLMIGPQALGEIIIDPLRKAIRTRGGRVQAVLGTV